MLISVFVSLFSLHSDGRLKRATFYLCQLSSDWLLLINRKWAGLLIERYVPEKTIRYLLCMTSHRLVVFECELLKNASASAFKLSALRRFWRFQESLFEHFCLISARQHRLLRITCESRLLKAAFSLCASQSGRTPLHLAANNGSLEVVRHLCLAGANIDAVTNVRHLSVLPLGRV